MFMEMKDSRAELPKQLVHLLLWKAREVQLGQQL
jgi:hypothetical protein